ncbi:50S ribosomal protein L18 [Candidatus Pandoraea novymonadis]|uniref:Large ribosomal subunit protein uL18 n=1 Tax=Candidatus Pandoraea novymonadis TaxID=1808959 RepID=A0ABX5FCG7_9BURK|nr:50S ribosomal protein L18 [Candidatus Pandoraea novymonadis]PSB91535.1 50S ribosomal protein L18 [Candidatus Pandoraea novymonadis]
MDKKQARLRRSRQTRIKLAELKVHRLCVHRTNLHIYAQVFSVDGTQVLVSASTLEAEVRKELGDKGSKGGNITAASLIGRRIAKKAGAAGIERVAFDRSGNRYHGRVKALADAAREAGLRF